ncbi:hypothetical protein GC197_12980 [bacterium]|nr:hypothetical protein [bacterium]
MLSRFASIRFAAIASGLLVMAAGCHSDPSVSLLESELRYLEDKVYALQDVVHRKNDQLESIRHENESLRKQLGLPPGSATNAENDDDSFADRHPSSSPPSVDELEGPIIELGESSNLPELESVAPGPLLVDGPLVAPLMQDEAVTDRVITQFELNPRLTGGYDMDGKSGDDGIMVVIEPKNAAGQYVPESGPVSIVLLDPAFSGQEGFVDRWDYDAADATKHIKKTLMGKGVHLKIPWAEGKPEHEALQLHVRYTTPDGEVLQVKKDIRIDLKGKQSDRWTPASAPLPKPLTASRPGTEVQQAERPGLFKKPLWRPFR